MKFTKKNSNMDLNVIAEFVIEEYRFMRTYCSAVNKLFLEEKKRFISAYTYHENKVKELLEKFGLRAMFYDGCDYDEGLPVTPLNADEVSIQDHLIVEQTYDPTIITLDGDTIKQGTVSLVCKDEEIKDIVTDEISEDKQ